MDVDADEELGVWGGRPRLTYTPRIVTHGRSVLQDVAGRFRGAYDAMSIILSCCWLFPPHWAMSLRKGRRVNRRVPGSRDRGGHLGRCGVTHKRYPGRDGIMDSCSWGFRSRVGMEMTTVVQGLECADVKTWRAQGGRRGLVYAS